jgi:hypothetical protein
MRLKRRSISLICVVLTLTFGLWAVAATPMVARAVEFLLLPGIGTVTVSNMLVEAFDQMEAWESYNSASGAQLGVENGIYRIFSANPGYVWGLNSQEYADTVTEVQVTPLTSFQDIGLGVMCRADASNNGDGYYFMISANGYYSIRIGRGSDVAPLVDWSLSPAVKRGVDNNTIRAVCLGNQLAMYVNDQLVANIVDNTYSSGFTGLTAAASDNGVDVSFDNLKLYAIQVQ